MIVYGPDFRAAMEAGLGGEVDPETVFIARVDPNGVPLAVFGFTDWRDGNIEGMLVSTPGGVTRALLRACARYVFQQLECARLTIKVRADNGDMLSLVPRIGFTHEGTMRRAHNGVDVLIFGMLRHECRWLPAK